MTYDWAIGELPLEPYYAAAVQSMASSWHNFVFGAFDPAGTLSVDKLPCALWMQALSARGSPRSACTSPAGPDRSS